MNNPQPMTPDERESIALFYLSHFRKPLWQRAWPWILSALIMLAIIASQAHGITPEELRAISPEDMLKTVEHMRVRLNEAEVEAKAAKADAAAAKSALVEQTRVTMQQARDLVTVQTSAAAVEADRDAQAQRAGAEHERANKAQALADHRGNVLGWLGATALGFLAMQLTRFVPMPYDLALPLAGGVAGYFAARLLL